MLAGASLLLHGVLVTAVVVMVVPVHRSEDPPPAMEMSFEAVLEAKEPRFEPPPASPQPEPRQPEPSPPEPSPPEPILAEPSPAEPVPVSPQPPIIPPVVVRKPAAPARPPRAQPAPRSVPLDRAPPPASVGSGAAVSAAPLAAQVPSSAPAMASAPPSAAWRGALSGWVQSRKSYPDEARRRAIEGVVGVRFTVARDGQVLDAQVVQGSGSDLLDQATLAIFRGARAPSFPADMVQQQVSITVAVRYRLAE